MSSLSNRLSPWLHQQWQQAGVLSWLLAPIAALVGVMLTLRRGWYASQPGRAYRAPVPVLIVGNIYVGGTGKTPVVIALVQALQARGWRPGVISRGYGVKAGPQPRTGKGRVSAEQFGDEPALITQQTGAPVAVHPNRRLAVEALLRTYPDTNLIISDDGLQHLALARDIEIVVQDARGVGNGRLMPAGPLREPASRLARVDAVITHEATPSSAPDLAPPHKVTGAVRHARMRLQACGFRHLCDGEVLTADVFARRYTHRTLGAAAGIGVPERFFATLRQLGLKLDWTLPLPDHHAFSVSPFTNRHADAILITAKDAVKCQALNDDRLWVVDVTARLSDAGFNDWLSKRLQQR